jgi:tRNA (mo5U34)-methyltransferase
MSATAPASDDLAARVEEISWYHSLELRPGLVTPGWFDTRPIAPTLPMPSDLSGRRCLDVGTFDGFWAYEMERRGAAEVVAVDVPDPERWDWPANTEPQAQAEIASRRPGAGFALAHEVLGSSVRRLERSVYELDPSELGTFDFVYLGSLLLHLRDPVRALERVHDVCSGELLLVETVDLPLSLMMPRRPAATLDVRGRPWWWTANAAGIRRMAEAARFEPVERPQWVYMPRGEGQGLAPLTLRTLLHPQGPKRALLALKGDPHVVIRARPLV